MFKMSEPEEKVNVVDEYNSDDYDPNGPYEADEVISGKIEIPDEFIPCADKENLTGAYMSTSEVADILGIHRNIVLYYTNIFYEYLSASRNPSNGRYRYTEEAVRQLAFLINDRMNNNRTLKQEYSFIQSKIGAKTLNMASNNVEMLEQMFNSMQYNIIESNKKMFAESSKALLEQIEGVNRLRLEQNNESKDAIERLEKKLDVQEERYRELFEEKNREIERLNNLVKEQEEQLNAKKKKRFFFK